MERNYIVDKTNSSVRFEFKKNIEIERQIKSSSYNAHWNPSLKVWVVPVDSFSINRIKSIVKEFGFTQKLLKKEDDVKFSYAISEARMNKLKKACLKKDFAYTPRDYQIEALAYSMDKGNVINGDDVGCISGSAEIEVEVFRERRKVKLGDFCKTYNTITDGTFSAEGWVFIKCFNEKTKEFFFNRVKHIVSMGRKFVQKMKLESGKEIIATPDHEILTDRGWIPIYYLCPNDKVVTKDGLEKVVSNKDFGWLEVYDIIVDDPHRNFVANDIVVHNCGKTFESILYTEVADKFPCLVVVPASVKYNWKEKWEEITKGRRKVVAIDSADKNKDWDADVVIVNYDILGKKQGKGATVKFKELKSKKWKMIIFDEAHFLKNKTAQRSIAAQAIIKEAKKSIVQLLSGTATMSKPIELWNLLKLSGNSDEIAESWMYYVNYFCGGYKGKFGWVTSGATNTIELNKRLRETCYLRREKSEVLKDLPKTIRQVIQFPITNKKTIEKALKDFIQYVRETKGDDDAEKAAEAEHLVALSEMRKLAIQGKMKSIERYLKDWKASERKLVVFGIHREALDYFSEKFKCPKIAGGVSSEKKQKIVKDWKTSNDVFLFVNIASGGTGVDGLQEVCSDMLIIELPWRPSDLTQTIGRLDRSGQKTAPVITFALNDDTIDKEMWSMLCSKEAVTEAVNKGIDVEKNQSGMREVVNKLLKR